MYNFLYAVYFDMKFETFLWQKLIKIYTHKKKFMLTYLHCY